MIKQCSTCGLTKPVGQFARRAASRDGYHSICKACVNTSRPKTKGSGRPAVNRAIKKGDLATVKELIKAQPKYASRALLQAAQYGKPAIVAFLMDFSNDIDRNAPLLAAVIPHATIQTTDAHLRDIAEQLLAAGASIEARDLPVEGKVASFQRTVLGWATAAGNRSVAMFLLEQAADVHGAVLGAAIQTCPPMAKELLTYGADVNRQNPSDGSTLLHSVANFPHPNIVARLIAHGADVNVKMNDGRTPLHRAAERNTGPRVCRMINQLSKRSEGKRVEKVFGKLWELAEFRPYLNLPWWSHFQEQVEAIIGVPRHLSMHPGGMIITSCQLPALVPLEPARMKGRRVCQ